MDIPKIGAAADAALTPPQRKALEGLHKAATGFESVFTGMLFKAMRDTVPQESIFGKDSNADQMFGSMLDEARSDSLAKNGGLGLAKVLETELRPAVIANAAHEAHVTVPREDAP